MLEPIDIRPRTPHAQLLALCAQCASPLSEVAEATHVPLVVLRAVAGGVAMLLPSAEVRVGAWVRVAAARAAHAQGARADVGRAEREARAAGCRA